MNVNIIKEQTLHSFAYKHGVKNLIKAWINTVRSADWQTVNDMKATFNTTDQLGKSSNRVVFNVGGNKFRIICGYKFLQKTTFLYVCWLGTHAEYDKICKQGLQYTIENFQDYL